MDVILISGHMSVLDQPKINLDHLNSLATYGEVGECNLTNEVLGLENAFFGNRLPINIDERNIDYMQRFIPNKKFKLQNKMYHDMEIALCTECFVDDAGKACSEEESSRVIIFVSGVFRMGHTSHRILSNQAVPIRPDEVTLIRSNGEIKKFMVSRADANIIYQDSVFPTSAMLDEIYSKKLKTGKPIKRDSIPLHELISKTSTTLSKIIDFCNFHFSGPKMFIVDGCRAMDDYEDLEARLASSDSEKSASSVPDQVVHSPVQNVVPHIKSVQPPITAFKSHPVKDTVKVKGSRIKGKGNDSLLFEPKTKGPRAKKGVFDSLMSLGKNAAGKKTRKKRKNKRK